MDATAYRDVHSYDGAAIERGHRDELEVLDPRPRDVELLAATSSSPRPRSSS